MDLQDLATRLGLALALGFVIGLERGWKERDEGEGQRAAGIRTFSLIGLLGGLFGALSLGGDRILLSAGFIATSAAMAAFIWRETARDGVFGATTLVAALVTFALGALAVLGDMRIAAGAGVVTVALLAYKTALHGFLSRITAQELRSALLLAAMTFIALPLLPDRAIDPWGALNPHQLWLITILIAAVSFAGYVAVKLVGGIARAGAGGHAGRAHLLNRGHADAGAAGQNQWSADFAFGRKHSGGGGRDDGAGCGADGGAEPATCPCAVGAAAGGSAGPGFGSLSSDQAGRAGGGGKA